MNAERGMFFWIYLFPVTIPLTIIGLAVLVQAIGAVLRKQPSPASWSRKPVMC